MKAWLPSVCQPQHLTLLAALSLVLGTSLLLTGCNNTGKSERRVPRVLQNTQKNRPTTPATAKPLPKPLSPTELGTPKPTEPAVSKPVPPPEDKPDASKPEKSDAKKPDDTKASPGNKVSNRSEKLPKGFLLAEDIARPDPFVPVGVKSAASLVASTGETPKASPASTNNPMSGLMSMFNKPGSSTPEQPATNAKAASPATPAAVSIPVLKLPIISVKGIVTSQKQAIALLSDDDGRTQTVKPGDMTYLSLIPSRVVAITRRQVVLEDTTSHKRQYVPIPDIIGFRPATSANGSDRSTGATGTSQAITVNRPVTAQAVSLPTMPRNSRGKPGGVVTSANGIIVLPGNGNATPPSSAAPLTLTNPEPPTLNVEKAP